MLAIDQVEFMGHFAPGVLDLNCSDRVMAALGAIAVSH